MTSVLKLLWDCSKSKFPSKKVTQPLILAIPDILSRPHIAIFPSLYIDEPRRHLNNLQLIEIDQDVLALLLALY